MIQNFFLARWDPAYFGRGRKVAEMRNPEKGNVPQFMKFQHNTRTNLGGENRINILYKITK